MLLLPLLAVHTASAQIEDSAPQACRSVADSEVLTQDDIRNAGLARLSDVFQLVDRWHSATIDGYTWDAQASGLSSLSNPRWSILVDGVPVEIGLFGRKSLDALPFHINDVECVELIARPHIAAGELRQAGAIHIHTRRPSAGMTLAASVSAGNEVNDPGPFAYTPSASENIDRIGPIGTGNIEVRSRGLYARLSGKLDEFHVTDQQIDLRAKQLYDADSKPRINAQAVAVSAGYHSQWGTMRVLAGRSETQDLLFYESFGLEIPATRRVDFAGGAGALRFGESEVRYRGSYVSHRLLERRNAGGVEMDFGKSVISGGVDTRAGTGPFRVTIGGSADLVEALTDQELSDRRTLTSRLFGMAETTITDRFEAFLFGSWLHVDERPGFTMMPSIRLLFPRDLWVGINASASRGTMAMDASLWRWTMAGYDLPERVFLRDDSLHHEPPAGRIIHPPALPEPILFTTDVQFGGRISSKANFLVGGYYRRSSDDYLADHDIAFSEASTGFLTNSAVADGVHGEITGFHASIGVDLLPGLTQRLTYVTESDLSGDLLFDREQARIPSHRASFTATYAPNDRFNLHLRARYLASTTWTDYAGAADASDDFYPWQLPHRVLIDVSATKRLWHNFLVTTLSVRNLLNEPYRAHPAGIISHMSFHFSVRTALNSEFRP